MHIEYMKTESGYRAVIWNVKEIKDIAESRNINTLVSHVNAMYPGLPNNTGYKTANAIAKRIA